jgi:DNA invertase Pin-like site-specific DNA recombinase
VSSDERLDQSFNSIDAQREAGQAYIASHRAEGWVPVADTYDDPGFSGGNTERPALKRLMADIDAGRIDIIVVYKIDRLTRSLADFAKMVEVFDWRGVSFSAVTQQINSATSMGRLMLNVLLSFAQFEREVTSERIRDKIAASKRKGLWMGGVPPLGYDVVQRQLMVNEVEAAVVRRIFQDMLTIGSSTRIAAALNALGVSTREMMAIFQTLKRSGALQAELVIN